MEKNPVHNARQLAERRYPLRSHRSAPLPCYGRRIFFITPHVSDMTLTTREIQRLQQWQDATLSSEVPPCNLLFSFLCFVSFFFSGRRKKERNEGKNFYYHTNHLGSTAFVTDQNQNVTQGFLYAPFGEITTEFNATFGNDIIPKYSFNAKELDEETGMYYYEARYYKPPVFTSRDAMFEKYFWMTPYAYCANNPVKYVDPSGEAWKPTFNEETGEYTGYQWIDPKYSYNSDGTLKDGLYEQAIFFSENGTYNPESKYNIGSSTATVYKSDGTTETFDACTHPSDASKYATIPAGIYTARRGIHNGRSSSYPAIRILGKIKLGGPNPRYPENDFAEKINIHKPGNNNFTGIGNNGPVSEGCLLIDINAWDRFLRCFSENTDISVTVSRTMSAPTNKNVRIFPFPIVTPICPIDKTRVDVPIRF